MAEELSEMVEGILPAGPIPLTAVQIEAARQLHDGYMPGWNASGAVLDVLRDARPGFDPGTVWLKVSALSALYGPLGLAAYTNLSAAVNCTVEVMSTSPAASAATVNAIEDAMGGDAIDAYRPFASKFVHFFVPSYGAVPIYDRWARERLDYHLLGPDELGYVPDTYAEFLGKIVSLQTSVSPAPSFRELGACPSNN